MPVPASINDLSTTASNNSPAGSESPTTADDYLRTHAAFIAALREENASQATAIAAAQSTANGKQAADATLTALAGVVTAANKLVYATGLDSFGTTDLSAFARTLLDDADAAAARTTLGALASADISGKLDATDKRVCTAWVNFNGAGTVAIRDSYNVSSITDDGAGQYTVNFATPMANANYSVGSSSSAADPATNVQFQDATHSFTVNGFKVRTGSSSTTADNVIVCKQVFGGK